MIRLFKISICLLVSVLISDRLLGQGANPPNFLENIITEKITTSSTRARADKGSYQLVKVNSNTKLSDLSSAGFEVIRNMSNQYYLVNASDQMNQKISDFVLERWEVNDQWKLQRQLHFADKKSKTTFLISSKSVSRTIQYLTRLNKSVKRVNENTVEIKSDLNFVIDKVITLSEVYYIGQESVVPIVETSVADMNLNPNKINKIHHFLPSINGQGMNVSIQELSYDKEDVDLSGRDIPSVLANENSDLHATEMATIVAGAGNSYITGKGVAWKANITSSDFSDVVPDPDQSYRDLGVWVQNHSYGTIPEGFYGAFAEAYDISANNNPNLLHVFSAGNRATAIPTEGPYQDIEGFSNLTGNFKMAKNLLVLGSVDTASNHLPFSSRGPAYDGRVKPELVGYASVGTSNSAAIVSGLSVLMQQAYLEQNGSIPASALLKAILINSAKDVGAKNVDFTTGYGNVDGYRSMENIMSNRFLSGTIDDDEEQTFTLSVPANVQNLKITLVWNDPAATIDSDKALVNDIDMVVKHGDNESLEPWVLNSGATEAELVLPARRKPDHLNNIEQITLSDVVEGDYIITLNGFDIPQGPQDYYIAYQWDEKDQFEWDYPTGSDNMPFNGESGSYFRWESTLSDNVGMLEYSIDNGNSWEVIDQSVDLSTGSLRWDVPMEISAKALARMSVGGQEYTTEEFTIYRPQRLEIGFNCGDSLLLQWNRIEGISNYNVFTYGDSALESIRQTADTAVIVMASEVPSRLFSVEPVFEDGRTLLRNEIIDYTFQGVDCYIAFFFSDAIPEDGVYLNLQLGTTYQVDQIIFERKVGEEYINIGTLQGSELDSASIRFLDSEPRQGLNINRARVLLANGQEVVTGESEIFFLTEMPFLVFPNPALRSNGLNVFTKQFEEGAEVTFILYDRTGKIILERPILTDRQNLELEEVKRGMYIYNIIGPDVNVKGRVMLE